tara:strand:+ start:1998 stop:2321 length:324 start_codon:yes stop_codon:yes gene_type:complete
MPRLKLSGGIPPHLKVIANVAVGMSITPQYIDALIPYVTGYASKYIFELKALGFEFATTKNGRNVIAWTLIEEPENADELRQGGKKPMTNKSVNKIADNLMKEIGLI